MLACPTPDPSPESGRGPWLAGLALPTLHNRNPVAWPGEGNRVPPAARLLVARDWPPPFGLWPKHSHCASIVLPHRTSSPPVDTGQGIDWPAGFRDEPVPYGGAVPHSDHVQAM